MTLLSQSIDNSVNAFCKCNFSMSNADVICYDIARVTLRGTVEAKQLAYLEDWVFNMAITIDIQGMVLTVDNYCPVVIQSLSDPECAVANVSTQQTGDRRNLALTFGLPAGCVAIVALITAGVVVIGLLIKSRKSSEGHWM